LISLGFSGPSPQHIRHSIRNGQRYATQNPGQELRPGLEGVDLLEAAHGG